MSEMRLMFEQNRREIEQKFDKRIDELDKKIDRVQTELKFEIQDLRSDIKVINERTESTKTSVYWILAALAVIVATPHMQKFLQWHETKQKHEHEPLLTNEEVKALRRLLAMNESGAGFAGK